jgi:hypothetical protein
MPGMVDNEIMVDNTVVMVPSSSSAEYLENKIVARVRDGIID